MEDGTGEAPREHVQGELVDGGAPPGDDGERGESGEQISSPTKLIRIASMVRTMLDEVRRAPLDDAGRRRLREIHEISGDGPRSARGDAPERARSPVTRGDTPRDAEPLPVGNADRQPGDQLSEQSRA